MKRKITLELFVPEDAKPVAVAAIVHSYIGLENDVVIVKSELVHEDTND